MKCLGIDIGGSGVKGAVVDSDTGALLEERFRFETPVPATPDAVAETVAQLIQHFDWQGPVGCGFPAAIREGVALTAANIAESWIGTDVAALFSRATSCPTWVLNDADAAGVAEMAFGAGKDRLGTVLIVTVGTGLGTALFYRGQLFPNTELGHIEIRGKDAEMRASDAARQREDLSWEKWAGRFNEYLLTMERLFWPELIIIGGGVSKKPERFMPYLTVRATVVPAQLRNEAGIVGAAVAAAQGAKAQLIQSSTG